MAGEGGTVEKPGDERAASTEHSSDFRDVVTLSNETFPVDRDLARSVAADVRTLVQAYRARIDSDDNR